jgi:aconitate hydratase
MVRNTGRPRAPGDPFAARRRLPSGEGFYALAAIADLLPPLDRLPVSLKILLENALRHAGKGVVEARHVELLGSWRPGADQSPGEIPFLPARVLLQDYTGVPAIVDLAALRDAVAAKGIDPASIRPHVPVDLVIDHSVQVDAAGSPDAYAVNVAREYERNGERYRLLRWAQTAFPGLRVIPPGSGIVHQVNLEFLAEVVRVEADEAGPLAVPDTVVGTDSHTTMVNGLGVLGYGVGGIEAEAVLLGLPLPSAVPRIVGVRLIGELPAGSTATDLVLHVTEALRHFGVVGAFVEFSGPAVSGLPVPDRATVSNMAPEYGATAALFPIDGQTLAYLRLTGRAPELVALVERYAKEQGLWHEPAHEPAFDALVEIDLGRVEASLAGPRRPQDRVPLRELPASFAAAFPRRDDETASRRSAVRDGSVVIAAITSCTNTSNPALMVTAGLVARNAIARGLRIADPVKTSFAPGSRAVPEYLARLGLMDPLEALGFHIVGYGCTTCIGNSGPLEESVAMAITSGNLAAVAVLSGNRNFEGRIHPLVQASYLASPPLVVAFALAGRADIDLTSEPLGPDEEGRPVFLREVWPAPSEVAAAIAAAADPEIYGETYRDIFAGDERWQALADGAGDRYAWQADSTYVAPAPFAGIGPPDPGQRPDGGLADIVDARVLVMLGDSVTTDHISPAGAIAPASAAGRWLVEHGVPAGQFNSYGSRRGHHQVMVRGTFANVRLRNLLVPGTEGPLTVHRPSGQRMEIFEAAERYEREGVPLIVIAGREYGSGSSRDWAAKGPRLLGVRAVLAQSFERIHRANLVGLGILPLRFESGEGPDALGLTGSERYSILGLERALASDRRVVVVAANEEGSRQFAATVLVEGPSEMDSYRAGGILPAVLARLVAEERPVSPIQPAGPESASRSSGRSTSGLEPSIST